MTAFAAAGDGTAATCPFDHHSAAFAADPVSWFTRLRDASGPVWTEAWGGFWVVSRYEDLIKVGKDPDTFKSGDGVVLPWGESGGDDIPLNVDPPEFYAYRRALRSLFTPRAADAVAEQARSLVTELIDQFIETGRVDFVPQFSTPIPARLTLRQLGMPQERWQHYLDLFFDSVYFISSLPPERVAAIGEAFGRLHEDIAARVTEAREKPGDDWVSFLVGIDLEGRGLSDDELTKIIRLMMIGGMETTGAAITGALIHLDRHPHERQRLIDDPSLIPSAVEESLRFHTPIPGLARRVTRDVELGGETLKAGQWVLQLWGAGNRDADSWERPDEFDVTREPNRHLAFGFGLHRCVGKHFARMEMRTALEEVLRRLPDYQIDHEAIERVPDAGNVSGYLHVPATFSPGQKEGQ